MRVSLVKPGAYLSESYTVLSSSTFVPHRLYCCAVWPTLRVPPPLCHAIVSIWHALKTLPRLRLRRFAPSEISCQYETGLDHGVGHPWLPLGPRRSTSAPQARGVQRLYRDAEGSQGAETVSEPYALPPRFSHGRSDGRIHALGRCHIGGVAYCVWVLPPNFR